MKLEITLKVDIEDVEKLEKFLDELADLCEKYGITKEGRVLSNS